MPGRSFSRPPATAAALLLAEGVHAKIVSERLGHSAIAITMDLYQQRQPNDAALAGRRAGVRPRLESRGPQERPSWGSTRGSNLENRLRIRNAKGPTNTRFDGPLAHVRPLGLEPRTNGLKVRCSTD